jgi:methylmalonyl-CoA mutase cobalamin-binding subunit
LEKWPAFRGNIFFFSEGLSIYFDNLEPKGDSNFGPYEGSRDALSWELVGSAEPKMQHGMQLRSAHRDEGPMGGGVSQFAAEVVARLVLRDGQDEAGLREALLQRFIAAISSSDPAAFEALKPELKRARISATALADCYIPEAARRLGEAWEDDSMSFASVTMGVARMQAILREIGTTWSADSMGHSVGPTLLVILPQGEQHTLGALVLVGRLRRMGVSVSMRIAPSLADLARYVAERTFDGALISIASNDRLETCRAVVKTLKEARTSGMKVAVGGAIRDSAESVMQATGADLVTNDIIEALAGMGLLVDGSPVLELS